MVLLLLDGPAFSEAKHESAYAEIKAITALTKCTINPNGDTCTMYVMGHFVYLFSYLLSFVFIPCCCVTQIPPPIDLSIYL